MATGRPFALGNQYARRRHEAGLVLGRPFAPGNTTGHRFQPGNPGGPGRKGEYAMCALRVGESFVVTDRKVNTVRCLVGRWNRKRVDGKPVGRWIDRKVPRVGMRVERVA